MPPDIYSRLRDLAASAEANPGEMRPVLLRVITDLFALHPQHTDEEIRLYEEMAGRLLDDADETTLTNVGRKLSRCADAPAAILKRIRARGGEPAREILLKDFRIEWRELRQIAASGACDQACAVAGRADLDREIARIFAARPEREIIRAIAANPLAPLSGEDLRLLAARGRRDAVLARALLGRGELTLEHLPLYLFANPRERSRLVVLALEAHLAQAGRPQSTAMLDDEAVAQIEAAAVRRKRASFALTMADQMQCDPLSARRLIDDECGDALALAFIAIGLPADAAARIFLIAFPKVALSSEIFGRNMRLFRTIPHRVASRLIEAIIGAPRGETAAPTAAKRPLVGATPASAGRAAREDARQTPPTEIRNQNRA